MLGSSNKSPEAQSLALHGEPCNVLAATLVDVLRGHARQRGSQTAFTWLADVDPLPGFRPNSLTFQSLDARSSAIASYLIEHGHAQNPVLLLYPPGLDFICAFLGCLYAGAVAVPLYPSHPKRPDPRIDAIAADAGATTALVPDATRRARAGHSESLGRLQLIGSGDLTEIPSNWRAPSIDPQSIAYLQYTSGSTSSPKGVMVSHANLIANLKMCEYGWGASPQSVMVDWLPHFHDMGLIGGILTGIFTGFSTYKMAPATFLRNPTGWLQAVSTRRGTIIGAPNFAYELCIRKANDDALRCLDLSSLEVAYCGAEPIHAATVSRFCGTFSSCGFKADSFRPTYGLAEATVLVCIRTASDPLRIEELDAEALSRNGVVPARLPGSTYRAVGCGQSKLLDGIARIVNPASREPLDENQIGEIWAAGPHIAQGYWQDDEATTETFRAYASDGKGPYLRTGDLGFIRHGDVFITGRIKDLIIIRGRNVYPQDLEASAERSHAAIKLGAAIAFSIDGDIEPQVVLALELERESRNANIEEIASAIRKVIAAEHSVHVHTIVFLRPAGAPRTSSGKVQRRLCRELFVLNKLDELGRHVLEENNPPLVAQRASPTSLASAIKREICRVLSISTDNTLLNGPLSALGLDSLMIVDIKTAIEVSFGTTLPVEGFFDGWTIDQFVQRSRAAPIPPSTPPIRVHREDTNSLMRFNVMPGRFVEENLRVKEYRVWARYAEATFDRTYHSEMLSSPDHLVFLSMLAHTQKLAYVCLCNEFNFEYLPDAAERFKLWPTNLRVTMPKLITDTHELVQRLWITQLIRRENNRYDARIRTAVASMEVEGDVPIFLIPEKGSTDD